MNELPAKVLKSWTGAQDSRALWLQAKWNRSFGGFYFFHFLTGKIGVVIQLFSALSAGLTYSGYFWTGGLQRVPKVETACVIAKFSLYKDARHSSPPLSPSSHLGFQRKEVWPHKFNCYTVQQHYSVAKFPNQMIGTLEHQAETQDNFVPPPQCKQQSIRRCNNEHSSTAVLGIC